MSDQTPSYIVVESAPGSSKYPTFSSRFAICLLNPSFPGLLSVFSTFFHLLLLFCFRSGLVLLCKKSLAKCTRLMFIHCYVQWERKCRKALRSTLSLISNCRKLQHSCTAVSDLCACVVIVYTHTASARQVQYPQCA